eukprot:gene12096-5589_t
MPKQQTTKSSKPLLKVPDLVKYGLLNVGDVVFYKNHQAKINSDGEIQFKAHGEIHKSTSKVQIASSQFTEINPKGKKTKNISDYLQRGWERVYNEDGISLLELRSRVEEMKENEFLDAKEVIREPKREYASKLFKELQNNLTPSDIQALKLESIFQNFELSRKKD